MNVRLVVAALLWIAPAAAQPADNTETKPKISIMTPPGWVAHQSPMGLTQYSPLDSAKEGRPGNVTCSVLAVADPETRTLQQDALDHSVLYSADRFLKEGLSGSVNDTRAAVTVDQETIIDVSGHVGVLAIVRMATATGSVAVAGHTAFVFTSSPGWIYVANCTAGGLTKEDADSAWEAWRPILLETVQSFKVEN